MGQSSQNEAVLFMGPSGVQHGMLWSDFEAILDGYSIMPNFANQQVKAAYVKTNDYGQIEGLVLFYIGFDEDGVADHGWNIPLRHLCEKAGPGPDLGAGSLRFVCRSQTPSDLYRDQLWNPSMKKGANDFAFVRDYIAERGEQMGLTRLKSASQAEAPSVAAPVETSDSHEQLEKLKADRKQLILKIDELKRHIEMLQGQWQEEVAELQYQNEQRENIFNAQLEKLVTQHQAQKEQNKALRQQLEAQKAQIESLRDAQETQLEEMEQSGRAEIEAVTRRYKLQFEQKLEEERAKMQEKLHTLEMDLLAREEEIEGLKEEIAERKRAEMEAARQGANEYLQKLEKLGVTLVAFHEGAGHINIAFNDIARYAEDPIAYAAEKCLVTLDRYKAWLEHHKNPVCRATLSNGAVCGAKLIKIDHPRHFKPGESDTCIKCQGDRSIANVLNYKR